jgi:L-cysteine desulfidase
VFNPIEIKIIMEQKERQNIISLIKREVIPAIGCTEPIAVALAVAKAKEELHEKVLRTETYLSANILKNSMGVGIPGTGMIGLPIAIALGLIIGKSEYGLEVLKDLDAASLEEAKKIVDEKLVSVDLKKDVPDKLYIEAHCYGATNHCKVIICGNHTHIASVELNGEMLMDDSKSGILSVGEDNELPLSFEKIYEFSMFTPVDELRFMKESAKLNKLASNESEKGSFGHDLGKTISSVTNQYIMGDSIYSRVVARTSSACDVRMAGAMIPVMSNSGSGNQGITATLPVVSFAEDMHKSEEELIRALTLSHLMVIYIKRRLGRLSGLCGVMVAGIGSAAGITYLMGGTKEQISYSIKNMIGNITGVICDGAKPSCAMKVSNAVSAGMISAMMAIDNKVVTSQEGIADEDIDKTIRNLTDIGSEGMMQTDQMVLDIMTHKGE